MEPTTLPDTITLECPRCGRKLAPAPMYRTATTVITRKCRNVECETRWQIKVVPTYCGDLTIGTITDWATMHTLDYTEIMDPEFLAALNRISAALKGDRT